MGDGIPVIMTGGAWKGCLGVVLYGVPKSEDIFMVHIDTLGTIAANVGDFIELTEEMLERDDFDFANPHIMQAEDNLRYKTLAYEQAKEKYERAHVILEECKNGGRFDRGRAEGA